MSEIVVIKRGKNGDLIKMSYTQQPVQQKRTEEVKSKIADHCTTEYFLLGLLFGGCL